MVVASQSEAFFVKKSLNTHFCLLAYFEHYRISAKNGKLNSQIERQATVWHQ
jgi:hypothetical protein